MLSPSTPANPDQLPPSTRNQPAPSAPGDPSGFSILEWNALTNRAKAILQALRACRQAGEENPACRYCSLAGGDTERGGGSGGGMPRSIPGYSAAAVPSGP